MTRAEFRTTAITVTLLLVAAAALLAVLSYWVTH
jgi:hypothetical protein